MALIAESMVHDVRGHVVSIHFAVWGRLWVAYMNLLAMSVVPTAKTARKPKWMFSAAVVELAVVVTAALLLSVIVAVLDEVLGVVAASPRLEVGVPACMAPCTVCAMSASLGAYEALEHRRTGFQ